MIETLQKTHNVVSVKVLEDGMFWCEVLNMGLRGESEYKAAGNETNDTVRAPEEQGRRVRCDRNIVSKLEEMW